MDMDNKIRLGRLIRDIEKLHDISKTANQHLEGLEESIATQNARGGTQAPSRSITRC